MNSEPGNKMAHIIDETSLSRDILIVDDEVANLKLLAQINAQAVYQFRPVRVKPNIAAWLIIP
jgi:hypothetical protein